MLNKTTKKLVVLSLDWNQTGYLMAELADAGVEATLLTTCQDSIGLGGYCRQVQTPPVTSPDYVEFVRNEVSRAGATHVYALCEPIMELMWAHEAEIPALLLPETVGWQREILGDRRKLYRHAERVGVRVPQWFGLPNRQAVQEASSRLGMPFVLRGTTGFGGDQVRVICDPGAALAAYDALTVKSRDEPFAQAFVQGQRCLFGGLFEDGEVVEFFAQQTVEAYPDHTSPSIRVQSLLDERLNRQARALFASLKWEGLACAEFIRDTAGDYWLLEINPRPWAAIKASGQCGVDLLRLFSRRLAGLPEEPIGGYRAGVDCVLFPQYLMARVQARRLPRWRDIVAIAKSLKKAPWREPGVMLHMFHRVLRSF